MASQYVASVSAAQVGSYFVQQYYQVYKQQRDFVHRFYSNSSSMRRVDGDAIHSASDVMEIHQLIMSTNFTGIEIKTINSMESLSGGVLVVLSGSVKSRDFGGSRRFVQTFFLAPQEKGFFVLNDVFHFVDAEAVYEQPAMSTTHGQNFDYQPNAAATHLSDTPDYPSEDEAVNYINSVHIDDTEQVQEQGYTEDHHEQQFQDPEQEHEEIYEQEEASYEQSSWPENPYNAEQEPQPAVDEPLGEPEKLTYASILRAKGKSSAPSFNQSSASNWSMPPTVEKSYVPEPVVQLQQQQAPVIPSSNDGAVEESFSFDEGESLSVYVRNLSPSVTTFDIAEEFKNFGRIKPDGIFLKKRQDTGVCYAFVEFEDVQSVHNAIQASPVQLCGRQAYVEERRANNAAASFGGRRGGRGRGRGGRSFGRGNDQSGPLRSSNGFRGY